MRFEVYADVGDKYRWRLLADNAQNVASSGESFASRSNAARAADGFKTNAASATFEVYEDAGSKWRWRAKSNNGQTIGSSGESFASKSNATTAADNVKEHAGKSTGP